MGRPPGSLRTTLVDAALSLIESEGLASLSLRKVARASGVSHAAPAHYFKDLRGLLDAVASRGYAGLLASMQAPIAGGTSLDRFGQVGRGYVLFAARHEGLYRAMFHPQLAKDPQPHDEHRKAAELTFAYVVSVVASCQRENLVRAGDPIELSTLAWSTVHGAGALLLDGHIPGPPESVADSVVRNLFLGFRVDP